MANTPDVDHPVIRLDMLKSGATLPLPTEFMNRKLAVYADQIGTAALDTLAMADLPASAVNRLIFVGGSGLMGVVENALRQRLPDARMHRGAAMTAIVSGLAIRSATAFAD
jgi:hypothetical chaperone protein